MRQVTRQEVAGFLRREGFAPALRDHSNELRDKYRWFKQDGFRVRSRGLLTVSHVAVGFDANENTCALCQQHLAEYQAALDKAGYRTRLNGLELIVEGKE